MIKDNIKFTRKIYKQGDSLIITLPPEIREYLQVNEQDEIILTPEKGKYGKYISLWKKK